MSEPQPPTTGDEVASGQRRWVLTAAIVGTTLVFLDSSTVNVALPALQDAFDTSVVGVQWVVNAYMLFLSSLMLLGGALGDRFGRRRIFAIGVVVFAVASVACGFAPSTELLILGRGLQGIGGALLTPTSLALIYAFYPEDVRGKAIGLWAGFTAITSAVGPVLGGWLIDVVSWRWIFFMNVPLAVAVLLIVILRVPERRGGQARGGLDIPGSLLGTGGLGGVVFALIESSSRGGDHPLVLASGASGLGMLVAFVLVERRVSNPVLPLSLFRSRPFSGMNVLTLLVYADLSAWLFFLPLFLIQVHGYSATAAGAAIVPFVLLMFVLSRWSGGLMDRFGARPPLTLGPLVVAAAFLLFFALLGPEGDYWIEILPGAVVLGLGMALVAAPLSTGVMAAVPDALAGTASGVNNAISRVAGLLAIAFFGVLIVAVFSANLQEGLRALPLPEEVRAEIVADRTDVGALTPPEHLAEERRNEVAELVDESFLMAFRWMMLAMAALAAVASAVAWTTLRGAEAENLGGAAGGRE